MTNREKYGYWEEHSRYDLDTASAMFETGRYLYSAFMCQQAMEKIVKGLHVLYVGDEPQKTHNIALLFTQLAETENFKCYAVICQDSITARIDTSHSSSDSSRSTSLLDIPPIRRGYQLFSIDPNLQISSRLRRRPMNG